MQPGLSLWRGSALLLAHVASAVLHAVAWVLIGAGALSGRIDAGWVWAWGLCLATAALCRLIATWLEGVLGAELGAALRRRMLAGILGADADALRRRGTARCMAGVLDAETIDRLAIGGGFDLLLAAVELAVISVALTCGAMPGLQLAVLAAFVAAGAGLSAVQVRRRERWAAHRGALTEQLIENMLAHRTRVVQQPPVMWHAAEDRELAAYLTSGRGLDRSIGWLEAVLPRGYVLTAVVLLLPALDPYELHAAQAITLAAILYGGRSMRRAGFSAARLTEAWVSARSSWELWRSEPPPAAAGAIQPSPGAPLAATAVSFTHHGRARSSLENCSLTLERGDFVLIEGAAGSGKSTLLSLLAGRRTPTAGLILTGGLDLQTLGPAAWRRRIAAAAQYHENHVLSASLGLNLLLGRPLPHTPRDLDDARQVCEELGLGPLLERMPQGLDQMVGETGWQLSHGERSRVFLARALLQQPSVVLLDEPFAALDAGHLQQCLECLFKRADSAIVAAHP